ncbi:MAG: 50S ribosomal protein L17, partial [Bacteroidales bacterium]|nr:50S ribosomal protein L17 [Bacteroidales bacterium]
MRHRKKLNHLSRKSAHRKAMLANMASSLILHKRITTTTAKAKELRTFVEPMITRSKEDSTHSRRMVFKNLRDKYAVSELFREVASKVGERPGGYTRIIKLGNRLGDNADMCIIELVDFNENMLAEKDSAKPKSARRRRGGKKKGIGEVISAGTEVETEETGASETVESVTEESLTEVDTEPVDEADEPVADTEPVAEAEALDGPDADTEAVAAEPEAESTEKEVTAAVLETESE